MRRLDYMEAGLIGEGAADDNAEAKALRAALKARGLSARHPRDLLIAFRADATKLRYADWWELMGYCAYSANPVGRFVLDVHGEDESVWPASDAICSALQIINHLQDCADDYAQLNRVYIPQDRLAAHGATIEALGAAQRDAGAARGHRRTHRAHARAAARGPGAGRATSRDRRLRLEIQVIYALAEAHIDRLLTMDPLAERAKLPRWRMGLVALRRGGRRISLWRAAQRRACRRRGRDARRVRARGGGADARQQILVLSRDAADAAGAAAGDVRDLFVLPRRRRHRRRRARRARWRWRGSTRWRADLAALYAGRAAGAAASDLAEAVAAFGMKHEDFLAVIDGMEMDVERTVGAGATDWATLDLYCDRVASAVGRLSARVFGMDEADGVALAASSRARAATHQHPARSRRGRRDRPALSAASRRCARRASRRPARAATVDHPRDREGLPRRRGPGARAFRGGAGDLRPHAAGGRAHAAHHGRGLRYILDRLYARGWTAAARAAEARQAEAPADRRALLPGMSAGAVHVIGAGLAGLSAAVELARARPAGRRPRGEPAGGRALPLLFRRRRSAWRSTTATISCCRATARRSPTPRASARRTSWSGRARRRFRSSTSPAAGAGRLRANDGPIPFWMLRAVAPRARHAACANIWNWRSCCGARRKASIADTLRLQGPLWERLIEPFLVAALNIEAPEGSAALAGQVVRETLAAGGRNYHPLVARDGLSNALVRPALAYLEARGGERRVRPAAAAVRLRGRPGRAALDFGDEQHRARAPARRSCWRRRRR